MLFFNLKTMNNKRYNNNQSQPFWRMDNWKMWIFGILLPIPIIVLAFRLIMKSINNAKTDLLENQLENQVAQQSVQQEYDYIQNQNPLTAQQKADKITSSKSVQKAAADIAHHLGTNGKPFSWVSPSTWSIFQPSTWTENDKLATDIIIWQRNNYNLIVRLYHDVYTQSRNLNTDLRKLLDDDQLLRLKKYNLPK